MPADAQAILHDVGYHTCTESLCVHTFERLTYYRKQAGTRSTVTGLIGWPQTTESNSGCHIACRVDLQSQ